MIASTNQEPPRDREIRARGRVKSFNEMTRLYEESATFEEEIFWDINDMLWRRVRDRSPLLVFLDHVVEIEAWEPVHSPLSLVPLPRLVPSRDPVVHFAEERDAYLAHFRDFTKPPGIFDRGQAVGFMLFYNFKIEQAQAARRAA